MLFETGSGLVRALATVLLTAATPLLAADTRSVVGGVLPVTNDGAPPDGVEVPEHPMPFADLTAGGDTLFTDAGGNLQLCVDGTVTTALSGRYLHMSDGCGAISESAAGALLDFGTSTGGDCAVAPGASPGNTRASRSGFYHLNRIKEQARGHLPDNAWLEQQLTARMNIPNSCGASWDGTAVSFYRSGGGCGNTGEIAAVYLHEWGHGMDDNGVNGAISNPSEGVADVYAALRLNTSCIGRGFRASTCGGYGDPCLSCTGVRDVDWAERASGAPHAIGGATGIDALCGSGGSAPCGGGVHCEGAVYAEAVWDLWSRDLPAVYGASPDTARELATELTYVGAGPVGAWYSCTGGTGVGNGCNADGGYLNYLAADDDDGDLTNGTPHMQAIFDAFDRHQIACPTPVVQDGGCAGTPATAPVVSATPIDRGVALSWTPVAGAVSYRIYHTEGVFGCDFGKTLVGETVGETAGTSFLHEGLANDFEASYVVVPMGPGNTCHGPASSCVSATPAAGANLTVDGAAATVTILSGDGDGFVDNCEEVDVTFEVNNTGTGSLTNVEILGVESPSHPGIDSSITFDPAVSASLAPCATALGTFSFTAADLAFNDTLRFDVQVTADELGGRTKRGSVWISFAESDLQHFASRTFSFETDLEDWDVTEGTFTRTGGGGGDGTAFRLDSSSMANQACDRVRSPLLVLAGTSTLSLWNSYDIEPQSAGTWYDRANVAVVEADGVRTVVNPSSGRLYDADSSGPGSFSGCNEPEEGWAGTMSPWGTSAWSAAALGSAALGGEPIQLEVTYATDTALALGGFKLDQVTVTDVDVQVPDAQADCAGALIFADGFETGDLSAWSGNSP